MKALLDELIEYFEMRDVRAALIGATALSFYAAGRTTLDVDLLTVDRRVLEDGFWDDFPRTVEVRRGDFSDPLAGVVRMRSGQEPPVDVVVAKYKFAADVVARASEEMLEGTRLRVARLADIILLKLAAGGPQDAWDIHQALAVGGDALRAEVERLVPELPLDAQNLWRRSF